jgi:glycerol-3-phosphate dehydrogenase
VRRTHLAFETRDHGLAVAPRVAALMAPLLGWTDRGVELAVAEFRTTIERLFTIDA